LVRQRNGSGEVITFISVGTMQIAQFADPSKLREIAPAIYAATEESGAAEFANPGEGGVGFVRQGVIEMSNRQKLSLKPNRP
jgi:flagellar hook protein FlgE